MSATCERRCVSDPRSGAVASRMPRDEQLAADDDGPTTPARWQRFTGAVSNFMLKPAVNERETPR